MLLAAPAGAFAPEVTRSPHPPRQMAPGQVPQPLPWRDVHPFFLLSPLMGLLSRAWSRLRGPGPLKPWLEDAVTSADEGEACLEEVTKAALATRCAPWGGHPPREPGDRGRAVEDGGSSCPDREANSSLPEAWGLSEDDEEYGGEEATSSPKEQGSDYIGGQPAPMALSLLRTLQGPPAEEETEEGGAAEDKVMTFFPFPPSHGEHCPGREEEEDGEAVNKVPTTSTSPSSPGSKPSAWVCAAGEEEAGANEEERAESEDTGKTSITPSSAGSRPSAWECNSGEESEGKDGKAEKEADPEPHSSVLSHRPLLRTWQHQPKKITEEDEEEEEDNASGEAEGTSAIPTTSAFMRAWVCWPGEDTEEEDEDNDSGASEEEGEAEGEKPPPSWPLPWLPLRLQRRLKSAGTPTQLPDPETPQKDSIPPTSTFLRAWVYRPEEDTEEEYEENEDEKDDSETAGSDPSSSLQGQSALLRDWTYPPGEETEGVEAAEWGEAEPFRVAIYLPGEKPPPPWPLPRLPLHLQRRLKSAGTPTQHPDPETPQKARKVHFSEKVSIHFLIVWAGPAQAARRGPWEQFARDRSRFARRIAQAEEKLGPCLTPAARARA
ncbi:Protein phosphatase 1 regulatory subunit 15A [Myotis davidii]|uniref:Protein phosphatase 1 regulatory subunit 15A n=1 Tax=Myotis davidii TaxID=225400 RepID=L5LGR6_MYODS|nr:Protein phosphatase 1 regulatory subunit 15A [Myotis davidii]